MKSIQTTLVKKSDRLASIIKKRSSYLTLFDSYIGTGTENLGVISINEAMAFSTLERNQVIGLFKQLNDADLGSYRVGRRNQPTRFELGVSDSLIKKGIQKSLKEESLSSSDEKVDFEKVLHKHLLRPDTMIEVHLPTDFSHKDAERLKCWIDTIPFD